MNRFLEYFDSPSIMLKQLYLESVSPSLPITGKIDPEMIDFFFKLPFIDTLILWIAAVPALYFTLVASFRIGGILPAPVRSGSRGSDIMAFEIVAGLCVLYLGVAGIIGFFGFFSVKPFDTNNLAEINYARSSFIENHLLVPMLSYQGWNLVLCLSNKDLYSKEMILHHFFAAVSAIVGLSPYFQWFALYFYGITELTNIPLTFVDVFKIFPQYQYQFPVFNQMVRYLFAISFFGIRLVFWPYYSYFLWKLSFDLLISGQAESPPTTVYILITHILLTVLQYFWGYRILSFVGKTNKKMKKSDSYANHVE